MCHKYSNEDLGFPPNQVHIFHNHFQAEPDFSGTLWKAVIIATLLAISALASLIWRTLLPTELLRHHTNL
jgi:hypothetical protein